MFILFESLKVFATRHSPEGFKDEHPAQECPNDAAGSSDDEPLAHGTVSTANMDPILLDTILNFDEDTRLLPVHQAGRDVEGIYPQVYVDGSDKHAMARLVTRKLDQETAFAMQMRPRVF